MDTLRGTFGSGDDSDRREFGDGLEPGADFGGPDLSDTDAYGEEGERDLPPAAIGQDERRMQVRAYNHWASLLGERSYPSIEDLEPENLPDFGPYSVLLDFSAGIEDPVVQFLGPLLAAECGASTGIEHLSDVPARSLLSRITDHYLQIMANEAPIGFEAEFVNQRGASILYRGILLPFSSDDESIDFIYGVINWKEMADAATADELLLEIDQALEADAIDGTDEDYLAHAPLRREADPIANWADSPANEDGEPGDYYTQGFDEEETGESEEEPAEAAHARLMPDFDHYGLDDYDEDEDEEGEDSGASYSFASLADYIEAPAKKAVDLDAEMFDPADYSVEDAPRHRAPESIEERLGGDEVAPVSPLRSPSGAAIPAAYEAPASFPPAEPEAETVDVFHEGDAGFDDTTGAQSDDDANEHEGRQEDTDDGVAPPPAADADLADWLASARECAHHARISEDRSRNTLYEAVGRAYDFSLAAAAAPQQFAALLEESGLSVQDRAPLTPVVKLVFGIDYDKTRLTEYATVLSHAHRLELERGKLAGFLAEAEGGLKGVVSAERRLRREESGEPPQPEAAVREALARKLRELEALTMEAISGDGPEFALVMVRRDGSGAPVVIGEIDEDIALIERAARRLIG